MTETVKCQRCGGDGWYSEHDPRCPGEESFCANHCPVAVQCEACYGTGRVAVAVSSRPEAAVE